MIEGVWNISKSMTTVVVVVLISPVALNTNWCIPAIRNPVEKTFAKSTLPGSVHDVEGRNVSEERGFPSSKMSKSTDKLLLVANCQSVPTLMFVQDVNEEMSLNVMSGCPATVMSIGVALFCVAHSSTLIWI